VTFEHAANGVTVDLAVTTAQNTGVGTDTISGFENLKGSAFNDTLSGSSGANVISGLAGNDVLSGVAGNDRMDGGLGSETIEGDVGDDALMGGGNDAAGDTVSYENLAGSLGVTVSLAVTTAQNTGAAGTDTLSGFENLKGSSKSDTLIGDGNIN